MKGGRRMGRDTKNTKPYTQYLSFVLEKKKEKKIFLHYRQTCNTTARKKIIWLLMFFCSAQNKIKCTAPGETENKLLKTF